MRTIARVLLTTAMGLLLAGTATADVIALWNFNDSNLTVDSGAGAMTLVNTTSNFETAPDKVDPNDPGGASLEVAGWPAQTAADRTNGIRFDVPTTGRSNIKVKWDIRHSIKNGETGPNTVGFQYSVDGGANWTDGPVWTGSGDQWYLGREVDLSSVPAVNDNADFAFRLVAAWQPGQGRYMPCQGGVYGNRKWRLDLVEVHNAPPPAALNTVALWDFDDKRDFVADYGDGFSSVQLAGGIALDGDGYSKDYSGGVDQLSDFSSSNDPSLKGDGLDTTGYPPQGTATGTAGLQFDVSTMGYSGIKLSFDTKHKMDSSRYMRVQYTTNRAANPVVWVNGPIFQHEITDLTQEAWWFNNNQVDLSSAPGVNNNPNFAFRIVTVFDPDHPSQYAASRADRAYNQDPENMNKHRFDMVRVTATSAAPTYPGKTIVEAKQMPEWQRVTLTGSLVSATHPDYFWVQTDQRTCGIKVYAPQHNLSDGWKANTVGIIRNGRNDEKYIYANSVAVENANATDVPSLFMSQKSLGGSNWFFDAESGAGQAAAPGGIGLNNIGLLVKVIGWVTAEVPEEDTPGNLQMLYINDGSDLYDGNLLGPDNTPAKGIRICLPKNFTSSYLGSYVQVAGVSSIDILDSLMGTKVCCIRRPEIALIDNP